MSRKTELTTADLVVLAVLLGHKPMHGYELVKTLEAADVEDWAAISVPQVYYSLRKMARLGHILPASNAEPSLGPNRIIYKPAKHALREMQTSLGQNMWVHHREPSPFITWVALAIHAGAGTIETQFARRAEFLETEIRREAETLGALKSENGPGVASARAMISLVIAQMQAELDHLPNLKDAVLAERDAIH